MEKKKLISLTLIYLINISNDFQFFRNFFMDNLYYINFQSNDKFYEIRIHYKFIHDGPLDIRIFIANH
jgi:hypothetical protein